MYMLLLGGYSHTFLQFSRYSPGKHFEHLATDDMDVSPDTCDEARIETTGQPDARRASEKVKAIEVRDEEETSVFRKRFEFGKSIITMFFTLANRFNACCPTSPLPLCSHFSYAAADKFIVQCVFRI